MWESPAYTALGSLSDSFGLPHSDHSADSREVRAATQKNNQLQGNPWREAIITRKGKAEKA